ncbi:hypothetical protein SAICODRAFT_30429 [Saitoella complicata NRRL Y-17804]|nr:uncharacterized protein SAICODRAFT_30429 [Saitoella complicata NRRL Y-17804]ODQ53034.1 hypothetical protein SAICODRAFT_30429 [Saitoella complicata NRRL Y-17804]
MATQRFQSSLFDIEMPRPCTLPAAVQTVSRAIFCPAPELMASTAWLAALSSSSAPLKKVVLTFAVNGGDAAMQSARKIVLSSDENDEAKMIALLILGTWAVLKAVNRPHWVADVAAELVVVLQRDQIQWQEKGIPKQRIFAALAHFNAESTRTDPGATKVLREYLREHGVPEPEASQTSTLSQALYESAVAPILAFRTGLHSVIADLHLGRKVELEPLWADRPSLVNNFEGPQFTAATDMERWISLECRVVLTQFHGARLLQISTSMLRSPSSLEETCSAISDIVRSIVDDADVDGEEKVVAAVFLRIRWAVEMAALETGLVEVRERCMGFVKRFTGGSERGRETLWMVTGI